MANDISPRKRKYRSEKNFCILRDSSRTTIRRNAPMV